MRINSVVNNDTPFILVETLDAKQISPAYWIVCVLAERKKFPLTRISPPPLLQSINPYTTSIVNSLISSNLY